MYKRDSQQHYAPNVPPVQNTPLSYLDAQHTHIQLCTNNQFICQRSTYYNVENCFALHPELLRKQLKMLPSGWRNRTKELHDVLYTPSYIVNKV